MKWLFVYAHPDDETVAAGGTIRKLVNSGEEVGVLIVTPGDVGKVDNDLKSELKRVGSIANLRRKELGRACDILGVSNFEVLNYSDGKITNEDVWGNLTIDIINKIEKYKPDFVVTFDHGGWYFHLDHVGVSLATLRATQRSSHVVEGVLFSLFHPPGVKEKWEYVYPEELSTTHVVDISEVVEIKAMAMEAHASQKISLVDKLRSGEMNEEYFQLVKATKKGKSFLDSHSILKTIS